MHKSDRIASGMADAYAWELWDALCGLTLIKTTSEGVVIGPIGWQQSQELITRILEDKEHAPTKSQDGGETSVLPAIRDKAKEIMDLTPSGAMSLEQIRALPDDDLWLFMERSQYNARWIYAQAVGVVGVIANLPAETIQSLEVGTKAAERPKCPGCGAIVAPPYVCTDCRANEREAWSRECQT